MNNRSFVNVCKTGAEPSGLTPEASAKLTDTAQHVHTFDTATLVRHLLAYGHLTPRAVLLMTQFKELKM